MFYVSLSIKTRWKASLIVWLFCSFSFLGDSLKIGLQKGFIRLPENKETPIICVGPGTGIAPMRAIIEERVHNKSHGKARLAYSD